jgi:hypothetical protein
MAGSDSEREWLTRKQRISPVLDAVDCHLAAGQSSDRSVALGASPPFPACPWRRAVREVAYRQKGCGTRSRSKSDHDTGRAFGISRDMPLRFHWAGPCDGRERHISRRAVHFGPQHPSMFGRPIHQILRSEGCWPKSRRIGTRIGGPTSRL